MTDAGSPVTPPNDPDSVHQGGFDLGGPPQAGKHYRVLARKYRPSSFDDLIGQDAVVRTVSNALNICGRLPQLEEVACDHKIDPLIVLAGNVVQEAA